MAGRFGCNAPAWKEDTAEDAVCVDTHTTPSTVSGGRERERQDFRCANVVSTASPRVSGPPPLVACGWRWPGAPHGFGAVLEVPKEVEEKELQAPDGFKAAEEEADNEQCDQSVQTNEKDRLRQCVTQQHYDAALTTVTTAFIIILCLLLLSPRVYAWPGGGTTSKQGAESTTKTNDEGAQHTESTKEGQPPPDCPPGMERSTAWRPWHVVSGRPCVPSEEAASKAKSDDEDFSFSEDMLKLLMDAGLLTKEVLTKGTFATLFDRLAKSADSPITPELVRAMTEMLEKLEATLSNLEKSVLTQEEKRQKAFQEHVDPLKTSGLRTEGRLEMIAEALKNLREILTLEITKSAQPTNQKQDQLLHLLRSIEKDLKDRPSIDAWNLLKAELKLTRQKTVECDENLSECREELGKRERLLDECQRAMKMAQDALERLQKGQFEEVPDGAKANAWQLPEFHLPSWNIGAIFQAVTWKSVWGMLRQKVWILWLIKAMLVMGLQLWRMSYWQILFTIVVTGNVLVLLAKMMKAVFTSVDDVTSMLLRLWKAVKWTSVTTCTLLSHAFMVLTTLARGFPALIEYLAAAQDRRRIERQGRRDQPSRPGEDRPRTPRERGARREPWNERLPRPAPPPRRSNAAPPLDTEDMTNPPLHSGPTERERARAAAIQRFEREWQDRVGSRDRNQRYRDRRDRPWSDDGEPDQPERQPFRRRNERPTGRRQQQQAQHLNVAAGYSSDSGVRQPTSRRIPGTNLVQGPLPLPLRPRGIPPRLEPSTSSARRSFNSPAVRGAARSTPNSPGRQQPAQSPPIRRITEPESSAAAAQRRPEASESQPGPSQRRPQRPEDRHQRRPARTVFQCRKCGRIGHSSRECRERIPPDQEWHLWWNQPTTNESSVESHPVPVGATGTPSTSEDEDVEIRVDAVQEQASQIDLEPNRQIMRNSSFAQLSDRVQSENDADCRIQRYHVTGYLGDLAKPTSMLVDTGSEANLLPRALCKRMGLTVTPEDNPTRLTSFNGASTYADGRASIRIKIGDEERTITFIVTKNVQKALLGHDALKKFGFQINFTEDCLVTPQGQRIFCHAITTEGKSKND